MKSDALSQSEVESLLHAAGDGEQPPSETAGQACTWLPRTLYEDLAQHLGEPFSKMLRTAVEVRPGSADRLTCGEFLRGLENPTYLNLLKTEPLQGNLILQLDPSILYPMIDRLLGGGETGTPSERPLTEIELRLASRIAEVVLDVFRRDCEKVLALQPEVVQVETDPRKVHLAAPGEPVAVMRFDLTVNRASGRMNLCMPFGAIEQIAGPAAGSFPSINDSLVEIEVQLAQTQISTADLVDLRVGDIITTEHRIDSPLTVTVDGVTRYHARPGTFEGQKAICIDGEVDSGQSREDSSSGES